jgi:DNA-binding NtrC family response regulator
MATVLVVQQDARGRGLLSRWLAQAGHEVREASTPDQATRRLAAWVPDLVIIDAGWMYREGLELLAAVLGDLTLPAVRTIVITSEGALAAHAEDLGAEYLARPVLREPFLEAVERALHAAPPDVAPIGYESAISRS